MNWDNIMLPKPNIENLHNFYLPGLDELKLGYIPDKDGKNPLLNRDRYFGPKHYNIRAMDAAREIEARLDKLSDKHRLIVKMCGHDREDQESVAQWLRMKEDVAKQEYKLALKYISGRRIKRTDFTTWRRVVSFTISVKKLSSS